MVWITANDLMRKLSRVDRKLDALGDLVRSMRIWLLPIRPLNVTFLGEFDMRQKFGIVLPQKPAKQSDWDEIASGQLSVTIADGTPIVIGTAKDDQETADRLVTDDRFVGAQDAPCKAEFSYIDDSGNLSVNPSVLEFALADTVPPVDAESLGATMLEEVPDEPPVE
jgi:hypothetical protein